MKTFICFILSLIVFAASFQNSLILLDYEIHREFYEAHCINKDKPNLKCQGKCQATKKSENSETPICVVKNGSFDFHFLPSKADEISTEQKTTGFLTHKTLALEYFSLLNGFHEIQPKPPRC